MRVVLNACLLVLNGEERIAKFGDATKVGAHTQTLAHMLPLRRHWLSTQKLGGEVN